MIQSDGSEQSIESKTELQTDIQNEDSERQAASIVQTASTDQPSVPRNRQELLALAAMLVVFLGLGALSFAIGGRDSAILDASIFSILVGATLKIKFDDRRGTSFNHKKFPLQLSIYVIIGTALFFCLKVLVPESTGPAHIRMGVGLIWVGLVPLSFLLSAAMHKKA